MSHCKDLTGDFDFPETNQPGGAKTTVHLCGFKYCRVQLRVVSLQFCQFYFQLFIPLSNWTKRLARRGGEADSTSRRKPTIGSCLAHDDNLSLQTYNHCHAL